MLKIADAIEARVDEINEVECKDTGKPLHLTMSEEMPYASDHFRFFARRRARAARAARPASTWPTTPRGSAASRSAWSARSRRGTTR